MAASNPIEELYEAILKIQAIAENIQSLLPEVAKGLSAALNKALESAAGQIRDPLEQMAEAQRWTLSSSLVSNGLLLFCAANLSYLTYKECSRARNKQSKAVIFSDAKNQGGVIGNQDLDTDPNIRTSKSGNNVRMTVT